jgi:4-diphosphocytidyl-2-C-methyl-D-erythritol kinase
VRLRALAPGKINLCLFLGGRRSDGRHELVTLIESLSLADELSFSTLPSGAGADEVICPGVEGPNLVSTTLEALRAGGWDAPRVRVEIVKRVPVAAGMGGGSSDAAAALRLAQQLGRINEEFIAELAPRLGADVPSQLAPGLVLGTGAGDVVEALAPLPAHAMLILPLRVELSTAEVYREAERLGVARDADQLTLRREELRAALQSGEPLPEQLLVNDLQPAALSLCQPIAGVLEAARTAGADQAIVCGSGPTVAGLYWGPDSPDRAASAASELEHRFAGAASVLPVSAEYGLPLFA